MTVAAHDEVRLLDVRGHLSLDISGVSGASASDALPTYAGTNPCVLNAVGPARAQIRDVRDAIVYVLV